MSPVIPDSLRLNAEQVLAQIDEYKFLHQHPELSHQEYRTADYLQKQWEELEVGEGVEKQIYRIADTGVVLVLKNGDGPVVGYRADIDGLPIKEASGKEYASVATTLVDGVETPLMHGCGHDTHMAVALWTARLFAAQPGEWHGTLVVLMQPAEETGSGAQAMVEAGLWEKVPKPEVLFGQHVFPIPRGQVMVSAGEFLAASDSLDVTVLGRGGHGSQPETTIDPIVLGAAMITRLQTIVSREVAPLDSAVVTVGMFRGGTKNNIIPDRARFTLNIRTFSAATRERVLEAVERIIRGEAMVAGAPEPLIEKQSSFPATHNDESRTARVQSVLKEALGEHRVIADDSLRLMGSEDFGLLAAAIGIPYTFWGFGGYPVEDFNSGEPVPGNHSPFFAPDPEVTLATGTEAAVAVLLDALTGN